MAPPPPARKVARAAARYRPGKAPVPGAADPDDYDSDDSEGAEGVGQRGIDDEPEEENIISLSSGTKALLDRNAQGVQRKTAGIVISTDLSVPKPQPKANLTQAQEHEESSSEYETDTDQDESSATKAPTGPVFRKPGSAAAAPPPHVEESEYETDSEGEEQESDEEEEETPKPLFKPIFVPKRARTTMPMSEVNDTGTDADPDLKSAQEAERRRNEAHDLAAEKIRRELAEQEHERTAAATIDIDDTDGLDPEAEFNAWKERETARLARDRELLEPQRKEQEELNRIKALPESEKARLGRERARATQEEKKEQRGQQGFLQKYYHKGSFFQDMDILKRDFTEKTTKDVDVSKLPKMMQVRGYGQKGRSKWTHLANEDTSKSSLHISPGTPTKSEGCFICGGDHLKKDCPNRDAATQEGASGSNRSSLGGRNGERRWGEDSDRDRRDYGAAGSSSASSTRDQRDRRERYEEDLSHARSREDRSDRDRMRSGDDGETHGHHDRSRRHRSDRDDDERGERRDHRSQRSKEERHHRHRDDHDRRERHRGSRHDHDRDHGTPRYAYSDKDRDRDRDRDRPHRRHHEDGEGSDHRKRRKEGHSHREKDSRNGERKRSRVEV